jgi:hypothetical protein
MQDSQGCTFLRDLHLPEPDRQTRTRERAIQVIHLRYVDYVAGRTKLRPACMDEGDPDTLTNHTPQVTCLKCLLRLKTWRANT